MPKHLIRRLLPDPERIIEHPSLRFMGKRLADPSLWHLNRRSAAGAMFWGLFCAMVPIPFQMVLATGVALLFRVNLALTIVLVWLSNPLTLLPLAWLAYWTGSHLLGMPTLGSAEFSVLLNDLGSALSHMFSSSSADTSSRLSIYVRPLVVGALSLGLLFGCIGYVLMRLYWRWHVVQAWEKRRAARQAK